METVRKTKITQEPTLNETIEESVVATLESEAPQTPPQPQRQTAKDVFNEAPELYGISPTPEQIESFRQREISWRNKLKNAI